MKAVFIPETGGPEVLTYGDAPEPETGPADLLVRVRAAALNRRDVFAREGSHGVRPPLPHVPGLEVAGEVAEAGPEARGFQVGDRVLGRCRSGGYAELARVEAADAYPFPEWMSFEEAACVAVPFGTAWRMLVRRAALQSGEDLLVMAAGSGIGAGAIQLGKLLGARVITTAGSRWKLDKAAELGADAGIDYREFPEFSRKVRDLTGGEGVHVVFEHIGAAVWRECFASLRRGGRFVNSGVTAGHRAELHLGQLWTRELTLMGTTMRPREDMPEIMRLVREGKLRGVVSEVLPLRDAGRAHELMESSRFFGKIVLTP